MRDLNAIWEMNINEHSKSTETTAISIWFNVICLHVCGWETKEKNYQTLIEMSIINFNEFYDQSPHLPLSLRSLCVSVFTLTGVFPWSHLFLPSKLIKIRTTRKKEAFQRHSDCAFQVVPYLETIHPNTDSNLENVSHEAILVGSICSSSSYYQISLACLY